MKELAQMSKEELLQYASSMQKKGSGNKEATLKILQQAETWLTLQDIADTLDISKNNVSSQLTPIRKAGHKIIEFNHAEAGKQVKLITDDVFTTL